MKDDAAASIASQWGLLEHHFRHHAVLVDRFREFDAAAVARMWRSGTNEAGHQLSRFERAALIERHCELFGCWPE
jgi:hypothetical protein